MKKRMMTFLLAVSACALLADVERTLLQKKTHPQKKRLQQKKMTIMTTMQRAR